MNENDLEILMKQIILEKMDNVKIPPKDELWEYISLQLDAHRRKERIRKISPVIAASAAIMLSVSLALFNPSIRATADNVIKIVASFADEVFSVNKSGSTELDNTIKKTGDPRIDEAQKRLGFDIMVPRFLPEGYILADIAILDKFSGFEKVLLTYEKNSKDVGKKYLFIDEVVYSKNVNANINYKSDVNTQLSKMITNGRLYTVISYEHENNYIMWEKDGMWFEIKDMENKYFG